MSPDLTLFHVLSRHGVPFVVIGGHAVNIHGYRRTTEDSDAVWIRSPESEILLCAALTEVQACYIGKEIDRATGIEKLYPISPPFIQANHLMMLWTKFGFLDLFDYIPGHPTADVHLLMSTSTEIKGLRFVSFDWLVKMKEIAGRGKDLVDLQGMNVKKDPGS